MDARHQYSCMGDLGRGPSAQVAVLTMATLVNSLHHAITGSNFGYIWEFGPVPKTKTHKPAGCQHFLLENRKKRELSLLRFLPTVTPDRDVSRLYSRKDVAW